MATLKELKAEKELVQERFQEKAQAASDARAKFRKGEITARQLDNIEKNLDIEQDKRSIDLRRINKELTDIETLKAGGSIRRQRVRKGAFKTREEILFTKGQIAGATPAQLVKAQQAAARRGERPPTIREFLAEKKAEEQAKAEEAEKKKEITSEQRLTREKEIAERRRRRALRIKLQERKADIATQKIQEKLGLFGEPTLTERIARVTPAPRPETFQETVRLEPAELKKERPPLEVKEFIPVEGTFELVRRRREKIEQLKLEAEKKGLTGLEKFFGIVSVSLLTIQTEEKIKRIAKTAGVSAAAALTLVSLGATTPVLVTVAGVAAAEEVGRIKEIAETEIDLAKRLEKFADETANVVAAVIGGGIGAKVGARVSIGPKEVKITRPTEEEIIFAEEVIPAEGTKLTKLLLKVEEVTKVVRTRVEAFRQRIKPPEEPEKLIEFIKRKDVDVIFGLEPPTGKPVTEPTFILDVPSKIRRFRTEPEPFEITGEAVREFELIIKGKKVKVKPEEKVEIKREIDIRDFKVKKKDGELILEKAEVIEPVETDISRILLAAKTKVTDVFKSVREEGLSFKDVLRKLATQKKAEVKPLAELQEPSLRLLPTGRVRPFIERFALEEQLGFPIVLPEERIKPTLAIKREERIKPFQDLEFGLEEITKQEPKPRIREEPITRIREGLIQRPIIDEGQIVKQKPIFEVDITEELEPIITTEEVVEEKGLITTPAELILPRLTSEREELRKRRVERFKGFDAFAKEKGKFKKVNKEPLTKGSAEDLATEAVDKTISATGKVIEIKKKLKEPPKDKRTFYSVFNRFKFRDFRTNRKGERTKQLPEGHFIEKRRFRLDSPSEVKEISVAKFLKQKSKPILNINKFNNMGGNRLL